MLKSLFASAVVVGALGTAIAFSQAPPPPQPSTVAYAKKPAKFPKGLKPCENEDGPGPCKWNARTMGNGVGNSFWIDSMACFHYLDPKADRKWGDHAMPCEDPYELDKTRAERSCQDAAAEGDESRMNARFAACHRKYGKH